MTCILCNLLGQFAGIQHHCCILHHAGRCCRCWAAATKNSCCQELHGQVARGMHQYIEDRCKRMSMTRFKGHVFQMSYIDSCNIASLLLGAAGQCFMHHGAKGSRGSAEPSIAVTVALMKKRNAAIPIRTGMAVLGFLRNPAIGLKATYAVPACPEQSLRLMDGAVPLQLLPGNGQPGLAKENTIKGSLLDLLVNAPRKKGNQQESQLSASTILQPMCRYGSVPALR